jgi:hypothetical protein
MNELRAGIYKHYKGGLYMVLGAATHSESGERLVCYVQLSGKSGTKIWVRPYGMFFETVEVGGAAKERFMYIGEEMPEAIARWYDPVAGYRGADRDEH